MGDRERRIESRILSNLSDIGYDGALAIRRAKLARGGFGCVDILLLSEKPRRLVLIEVKKEGAYDSAGKVVGQLLLYYVAALRLGSEGVDLLRQYAAKNRRVAAGAHPKSLQMLTGKKYRQEERALRRGKPVDPREVVLMVGLGEAPSASLRRVLTQLATRHNLIISVVIARGHDRLKVWWPHTSGRVERTVRKRAANRS